MVPVTGGANRKWGFTGKVETRSYERLVDALIDFVETGDGLKERFLAGFTACLAADRKSVFLATRTAPRRMVTVSSRQMRPPNTSARWMGAGRSVHSSVRNTATTISLITKMTAIRRSTVTWIR